MKDLEKIKSEDLGCQVQDANPANFAIEQEVAALVGATVPAPTEPSADDARELGAQLLVFLRRALLPIRSALRTAVADIYAHLDSRCTDYTPAAYASYQPLPSYDPMGTPPTPRTVANLLTALTAFSDRKISDLGDCPDGIPFMTLMTSKPTSITKIGSTEPYDLCYRDQLYAIISALPNLNEMEIHCKRLTGYSYAYNVWFPNTITKINGSTEVFEMPELERFEGSAYIGYPTMNTSFKVWRFPKIKYMRMAFSASDNNVNENNGVRIDWVEEVYMPTLNTFGEYAASYNFNYFTVLKRAIFGNTTFAYDYRCFRMCPMLIHLEFGADGNKFGHSNSLASWSPTMALRTDTDAEDYVDLREDKTLADNLTQFLRNFREYIALRLTANGNGLTLTLSQAVRNAIHAAESTYGIENIIVTQKGWTISPAPGASSQ